MHIMFNNPLVYVVEYSGLEAVEVIDKRVGRGALIRDDAAKRFREELKALVDEAHALGRKVASPLSSVSSSAARSI